MNDDALHAQAEDAAEEREATKAVCAFTVMVLAGNRGVEIRSAAPGPNMERVATALDIRGACTEVLQMLQGQMTAQQLVQIQARMEAEAQAQAAAQAELARQMNGRGGKGIRALFGERH